MLGTSVRLLSGLWLVCWLFFKPERPPHGLRKWLHELRDEAKNILGAMFGRFYEDDITGEQEDKT